MMNFLQRAALAGAGAALTSGVMAQSAPVAPIKPKVFTDFGITRTDNYYWLNQPTDPAVLKYLNDENGYYDKQMAGAQALQKKLALEIKNRIKQDDATEPYRDNGYYYYSRYEFASEYPIYCRKKGSVINPEEILLNGDEMGTGQAYFQIGDWAVSTTLKSRHPGGTMTTETHQLDMATMGRDNSLGTIVTTMDSSVIALPTKIVQIIQTTGIRIKIETSFGIILITTIDNTITIVCQTLTSKTIRDITPVEIKIMRDSTRIPHTVPNTMIRM